MWLSNFRSVLLAALSAAAFISGCNSGNYTDLEVLGVNCPARDRCQGYRNHLTYMDRSCECDHECTAYTDCCIDASPDRDSRGRALPRPAARTDVTCLHYGEHDQSGVYVINKCSRSWNGPRQVIFGAFLYSEWLPYLLVYSTHFVLDREKRKKIVCTSMPIK